MGVCLSAHNDIINMLLLAHARLTKTYVYCILTASQIKMGNNEQMKSDTRKQMIFSVFLCCEKK